MSKAVQLQRGKKWGYVFGHLEPSCHSTHLSFTNSLPQQIFIEHLLWARHRRDTSDQDKAAVLREQTFQEGRKTINKHTIRNQAADEESDGAATSQRGQRRPESTETWRQDTRNCVTMCERAFWAAGMGSAKDLGFAYFCGESEEEQETCAPDAG